MKNDNKTETTKPVFSDVKFAIIGLVVISGLATMVMLYTGVGTEQIDAVFGIAIGAIAGLVSSK